MTERSAEFVWVRCSDKRTAMAVKPRTPPEIIAFDCDAKEIGRFRVTDVESITKAMDKINEKYTDKAVVWGRELDDAVLGAARESRKLVVALFGDEKPESEETAKEFEHKSIAKHHGRIVFVRVGYDRESELAKKWNVTQCPTVVMIDPSKIDEAKPEESKPAVMGDLAGKQKQQSLRAMIVHSLDKMSRAQAKK